MPKSTEEFTFTDLKSGYVLRQHHKAMNDGLTIQDKVDFEGFDFSKAKSVPTPSASETFIRQFVMYHCTVGAREEQRTAFVAKKITQRYVPGGCLDQTVEEYELETGSAHERLEYLRDGYTITEERLPRIGSPFGPEPTQPKRRKPKP